MMALLKRDENDVWKIKVIKQPLNSNIIVYYTEITGYCSDYTIDDPIDKMMERVKTSIKYKAKGDTLYYIGVIKGT